MHGKERTRSNFNLTTIFRTHASCQASSQQDFEYSIDRITYMAAQVQTQLRYCRQTAVPMRQLSHLVFWMSISSCRMPRVITIEVGKHMHASTSMQNSGQLFSPILPEQGNVPWQQVKREESLYRARLRSWHA